MIAIPTVRLSADFCMGKTIRNQKSSMRLRIFSCFLSIFVSLNGQRISGLPPVCGTNQFQTQHLSSCNVRGHECRLIDLSLRSWPSKYCKLQHNVAEHSNDVHTLKGSQLIFMKWTIFLPAPLGERKAFPFNVSAFSTKCPIEHVEREDIT
jgi:hypothetical protein